MTTASTRLLKTGLFLFLTLAFSIACKKGSRLDTFVHGRVITNGTNDKASSKELKINLYRISSGGGVFGGGETLVEEGFTDTNGYYSFSFRAENDYTMHWVRLEEVHVDDHFSNYPSDYRVKIGEHQLIDIVLAPNAWVRLHVENVNPQFGDKLSINWGGAQGSRTFDGPVNTEVIFQGGGNLYTTIPIELNRNGEWSSWNETVWMPAWDTAYHKIEY
jgi:hypothetical protein